MAYDWEGETSTAARSVSAVRGYLTTLTSYALFALGIVAFWSFFAPYLDAPTVAWYAVVLPEIAAPTEGDAVVDVAPLIAGLVTSFVAVWLR